MPTDELKKQSEWYNLAGGYLVSAKILDDASGPAAPIVHLAWQAAENDLKSLSVGHSVPITHNIGAIMTHLRDNSVLTPDDITQLSAKAVILTGSASYNDTRYPENDPSYWSSRTRDEIASVVVAAEQIHAFTAVKIKTRAANP